MTAWVEDQEELKPYIQFKYTILFIVSLLSWLAGHNARTDLRTLWSGW